SILLSCTTLFRSQNHEIEAKAKESYRKAPCVRSQVRRNRRRIRRRNRRRIRRRNRRRIRRRNRRRIRRRFRSSFSISLRLVGGKQSFMRVGEASAHKSLKKQ